MYKEISILAFGIILGMISMYYIMKPSIGSRYQIKADIKNKKGVMNGNAFSGGIDAKTPKKEGLLKRLINKGLTKKRKNEIK